jgi:ribosomal protein S18 acetylase RimI-like enzyme
MVDPLIRPATVDDIAELVWLEQIARTRVADQRGGDLWLERHASQSPDWMAVPAGRVVVGTIDDAVVGYLRFEQVDDVMHVNDVFVHPEAREVGFGDALLAATVEIARRHGASRIEAEALPGDRETKNLYERAGITAKRITVSSRLADLDDD